MNYDIFSYDNENIDFQLNDCNDTSKLKSCVACGKFFVADSSRRKYCNRTHYRICKICNNEFEIDLSAGIKLVNQTCSRKCANELTRKSVISYNKINPKIKYDKPDEMVIKVCEYCKGKFKLKKGASRKYCTSKCRRDARIAKFQSQTRICKLCGKEFHPVNTRNWYCQGPHYIPCVICGKQIEISTPGEIHASTCSNECKQKLRSKTSLEKYGTDNPAKSSITRKKLHDIAVQNELSKQKKLFDLYGVTNVSQIPEVKAKISQTVRSEECRQKTINTNIERYGVPYAMHSRELSIKQTNSARSSMTCDGTKVDSSYEKIVYDFCVRNNLKFETQIPIEYEYNGKIHITYIDFKIEDIFFECKGTHLLHGCFDYDERYAPIEVKLELYKKYHVILITDDSARNLFGKPNSLESNGLKYQSKCPNPLIGVDISLFCNPKFPYKNDRPPIFYRVKVNNQLSSFDAFFDESIRWKMIINRIMYSGGFIDNQQVLNAMNICRICKQPSWFSKSFAKQVIKAYVTSDTIVDPFAGWGTRYDAAIELHKNYIGCDLNEDLVTWHKNHGRDIQYNDAKSFKYDGNCSVFICPPYKDIEVYFNDQDSNLTQCQWLEIVMSNVPNASEYTMVCKIVDDDWKKYVVDIKKNSSHFGQNNEYILVVPGKLG